MLGVRPVPQYHTKNIVYKKKIRPLLASINRTGSLFAASGTRYFSSAPKGREAYTRNLVRAFIRPVFLSVKGSKPCGH